MRQAVQISFVGHCSPSVTVPVAFHILLVRTAVYCHINMYSFLPEGVNVINVLWGLAATLDSEAGASYNRRSSPTLIWSVGRGEEVGTWFGRIEMLFIGLVSWFCQCGWNPHTSKQWSTRGDTRSNTKQDVCFSQMAHSHTTSAPICINKLQASTGKQTLLLEASTTGHHMCLLR